MMPKTFLERKSIGNIAKQFVSDLFSESGFEVYQLGYESFFSNIKNKIRNNEDTISLKIRSMPDILVIGEDNLPIFIEVKYRSYAGKIDIKENDIENYKRFWPESFIICVIPDEIGFYAQQIKNINLSGKIKIFEDKRIIELNIQDNFYPIKSFDEFKDIKDFYLTRIKNMIYKIEFFKN